MSRPRRTRFAATSTGESFAKPRIFINRENAVGTLCFPNDRPLVWKILYDAPARARPLPFFFCPPRSREGRAPLILIDPYDNLTIVRSHKIACNA